MLCYHITTSYDLWRSKYQLVKMLNSLDPISQLTEQIINLIDAMQICTPNMHINTSNTLYRRIIIAIGWIDYWKRCPIRCDSLVDWYDGSLYGRCHRFGGQWHPKPFLWLLEKASTDWLFGLVNSSEIDCLILPTIDEVLDWGDIENVRSETTGLTVAAHSDGTVCFVV